MKSRFVVLVLLSSFAVLHHPAAATASCNPEAMERLQAEAAGGDVQAASKLVALAEQYVEECPGDADLLLACGDVFENENRLEAASDAYRRAASADSDLAVPWARLANIARQQDDLEAWELYLDSARALETSDLDRVEIARAAKEPADSEGSASYAFKSADQIGDGLRVGSKSIRPKAISKDSRGDYFVGSKGFGVNLGILFEVSETSLMPEGSRQLEQLGRALERAASGEKYLIEGHSSSEGDEGFNERLSTRRAEAIADVLVREYGIDPTQIEFVGRGTEFPILEGGVENRSKSRRVTVLRLYDE